MPLAYPWLLCAWLAVSWSSSSSAAQETLVADFRKPSLPQQVTLLRAERDMLANAGGGTPAFTVQGRLGGSFSAAGARDTVYLVQPLAHAGALHAAPMLRTGLGRDARSWPLPEPHPNAIEGVVDLEGDGTQEIVLRTDSYHMGISSIRIGVLSLADGQARVLLPLTEVYSDTCSSPVGAKQINAKTLHWRADADAAKRWAFETFMLDCPVLATPARLTGRDYNAAALEAETRVRRQAPETPMRVDFHRDQAFRGRVGSREWRLLSLAWQPNAGGPARCVLAASSGNKVRAVVDVLEGEGEPSALAWSCDGEPELRVVDLDGDRCPEFIALVPMRPPSGERFRWPIVLRCDGANVSWAFDADRSRRLRASLVQAPLDSVRQAEALLRAAHGSR